MIYKPNFDDNSHKLLLIISKPTKIRQLLANCSRAAREFDHENLRKTPLARELLASADHEGLLSGDHLSLLTFDLRLCTQVHDYVPRYISFVELFRHATNRFLRFYPLGIQI